MKIKLIDNETIHFYSDSGELLLSEDLFEALRPELVEELLEHETRQQLDELVAIFDLKD